MRRLLCLPVAACSETTRRVGKYRGLVVVLARHGVQTNDSMASLHAVATLMGGKPLPDCSQAPHGAWHWIDPTIARPLEVDSSGDWSNPNPNPNPDPDPNPEPADDTNFLREWPDWRASHPNLHPNPTKVDSSGDWAKGQLIAPPPTTAGQPAWLAHLRSWREGCVAPLRLEESPVIFDDPKLRWTQTSFVHVQVRVVVRVRVRVRVVVRARVRVRAMTGQGGGQ